MAAARRLMLSATALFSTRSMIAGTCRSVAWSVACTSTLSAPMPTFCTRRTASENPGRRRSASRARSSASATPASSRAPSSMSPLTPAMQSM